MTPLFSHIIFFPLFFRVHENEKVFTIDMQIKGEENVQWTISGLGEEIYILLKRICAFLFT